MDFLLKDIFNPNFEPLVREGRISKLNDFDLTSHGYLVFAKPELCR